MKILKLLLTAIIITSLTSCKEDELKCDSSLVKKTVIELFEKETLKDIGKMQVGRGIDRDYLKQFWAENVEISLIRTKGVNKELKSCECSANIELKLKPEIVKYVTKKAENKEITYSVEYLSELLNQKVDIDYNVQETSDGEIYVETIMPDEIGDILGTSFNIETFYKKNKLVLEKDTEYKFGYGTEDCSYEITFIIKQNEKVEGTHNQNCIGDMGAGLRKFTGEFKNGKIIGKIKDGESFELNFRDKIMKYTLTKSIMQNGKEITYSEESRSKMTIEYELIE